MEKGGKLVHPEELVPVAQAKKAREEKLVARLRQRDQAAVAVLYANYSTALYGTIFRILRTEPEAEDILQETFLKIWRHIDQYDAAKASLFTWMLNIARHLAIDQLRSRQRKHQLRSSSMEEANLEARQEQQPAFKTDHIGLRELTRQLKPEQKRVIDLLFFEGYTQAEAAEALNLPLGTVKTHSRMALKCLAGLL